MAASRSVTDDRIIGGFRNRLVAGVNILNGSIDNQQFANLGGQKGALLSSSIDRSKNTSLYVEDSRSISCRTWRRSPARSSSTRTRDRQDRFLSDGDQSGATEFNLWARRPACCGRSIRPGRSSPTSRAAPRCRASAKARSVPAIPIDSLHQHPAADRDDL